MLEDNVHQATAGDASVATTGYEFNATEERVFSSTLFWLQVIVVTSALSGAVQLWSVLSTPLESPSVFFAELTPVIISFVVAGSLWRCQRGFKLLVRTEGSDIPHLLDALRGLRFFSFVLAFSVGLQVFAVGIVLLGLGM